MSLVKRRWLVIGTAGSIAIGVPLFILSPQATLVMEEGLPPKPPRIELPVPVHAVAALSAPVFAPERLPPDLAAAGPGNIAATSVAPQAPLPALVGIASHGGGNGVALVRGSDGQTVMLRAGEQIDGWTLDAIAGSSATFRRGSESQTATLNFANKDQPARAPLNPGPAQSSLIPENPTG